MAQTYSTLLHSGLFSVRQASCFAVQSPLERHLVKMLALFLVFPVFLRWIFTIDMQLSLQQCRHTDLDTLTKVSRETFIDAFEKDNNPKDFKTYIDFAFGENKLLGELKNPGTTFYFVYRDDVLVGYLKLNENQAQTDIKSKDGMELERIYVLKDFQGQHIGRWMLGEVKKMASQKQKSFIWLGVWEKNLKAIKFYQNHGFSKFGSHPYYVGKDKQTDWLMRFEMADFIF